MARYLLIAVWLCHALICDAAITWYVSAFSGDDRHDGLSPERPLRSIQAAVDRAGAGDTILVGPGVYYESVKVRKGGEEGKPLTIRASDFGEGRVVITGADEAIRAGKVAWESVDETAGLYRIHWNKGWPARVLYSGWDLYPYSDLEQLRNFRLKNGPGPRHGYTWVEAEQALYVRLHPDGRYGSRNPNEHVMSVAPPTGIGFDGTIVTEPSHYNIGVDTGDVPAHVVIDGFTFETPGVAGVYTASDQVTVRNSWFRGCRTGVAGNYRELELYHEDRGPEDFYNLKHTPESLERAAAGVVVEHCDFTQRPMMEDVRELVCMLGDGADRGEARSAIWHRKSVGMGLPSEHFKYEIGIVARAGRDWVIRRNYVHDAFEGLSCHAVSGSEGMRVEENIFELIGDNGVETECHAQNMHIAGNVFLDNMEPFSMQPLRGVPWPGSIVFENNVIINREENVELWPEISVTRGAFKIGMTLSNWGKGKALPQMVDVPLSPIVLPGDGLVIRNNLVYFPHGRLFTIIGDRNVPIEGTRMHDNLFLTDYLSHADVKKEIPDEKFHMERNTVAPARNGVKGPGELAAGRDGKTSVTSDAALREADPHWLEKLGVSSEHGDSRQKVAFAEGWYLKLPPVGPIHDHD